MEVDAWTLPEPGPTRYAIQRIAAMATEQPPAPQAGVPPSALAPPGAEGTPSIYTERPIPAGALDASPSFSFAGAAPSTAQALAPGGASHPRRGPLSGPSLEALHQRWDRATDAKRAEASRRLSHVQTLSALLGARVPLDAALSQIALQAGESPYTIRNWYYRARRVPREEWAVALLDQHHGRGSVTACTHQAWEWFCAAYLRRSRPEFSTTYDQLTDLAGQAGWQIPPERTLRRHFAAKVDPLMAILLREGPDALRAHLPSAVADKSALRAGQVVSMDGLKLDTLWVQFPGATPPTNAAVALCGRDVHSGRIVTGCLGETECTDLIAEAVHALLGVCLPETIQIDNTRAMANKTVTGQSPHRHRFRNNPMTDPVGLLVLSKIAVQWTNPDTETASPGQKPVERTFRDLHKMIRANLRFANRGYSAATAIPSAEVAEVLAEEIQRYNLKRGRRTPVCNGELSYDQAWARSVEAHGLRLATQAQRDLWLMRCEVCTVNAKTGVIALRAGLGPHGARSRYAAEALVWHMGEMVTVWYHPNDLSRPVNVRTMDGAFICTAEALPGLAFGNRADALVWHRLTVQKIKTIKAKGAIEARMDVLAQQVHALPEPQPEARPAVIQAAFGGRVQVRGGELVDVAPAPAAPETVEARRNRASVAADNRMLSMLPPGFWDPPSAAERD